MQTGLHASLHPKARLINLSELQSAYATIATRTTWEVVGKLVVMVKKKPALTVGRRWDHCIKTSIFS